MKKDQEYRDRIVSEYRKKIRALALELPDTVLENFKQTSDAMAEMILLIEDGKKWEC